METEVLIVGLGPAGASLSYLLARDGVDFVAVDRSGSVGKPVICGEFIPYHEELIRTDFRVNGLEELYERFVRRKDVVVNEIDRIIVEVKEGKTFRFDYRAYIVNKDVMLQRMVEEARQLGGRILTSTRLLGVVEKGGHYVSKLSGPKGELHIESKIIVGADGFFSVVARSLGFERGYTSFDSALTCNQKFMDVNIDSSLTLMELSAEIAPGGYGWIIPRGGGEANVGIGVRSSIAERCNVHELQDRFVKGRKEMKRAKALSGLMCKTIPVGGLAREIVKGNAALLGDAAGMVVPTNGGGIPTAMASAIIFSRALRSGGGVKEYEVEARRVIGGYLDVSLRYRKVADKMLFSSKKLKSRSKLIPNNWMFDIISGKKNRMILALYPLLIKLF